MTRLVRSPMPPAGAAPPSSGDERIAVAPMTPTPVVGLAAGGEPAHRMVEGAHPKRVLIIDDQEVARRILDRVLRSFGYQTELARSGEEALSELHRGIDLVILDARMPGMNGFQLTRCIRRDPQYFDLPVVMVTGLDGKEERLNAVEAGIKQHTIRGARMLHGAPSEYLRLGEVIALTHHERWDGSGYPRGLAAETIPLAGRICAVADVFDALTNERNYREALPTDTVYAMLVAQRGRHFDPRILDVFLERRHDVERIQRSFDSRAT